MITWSSQVNMIVHDRLVPHPQNAICWLSIQWSDAVVHCYGKFTPSPNLLCSRLWVERLRLGWPARMAVLTITSIKTKITSECLSASRLYHCSAKQMNTWMYQCRFAFSPNFEALVLGLRVGRGLYCIPLKVECTGSEVGRRLATLSAEFDWTSLTTWWMYMTGHNHADFGRVQVEQRACCFITPSWKLRYKRMSSLQK